MQVILTPPELVLGPAAVAPETDWTVFPDNQCILGTLALLISLSLSFFFFLFGHRTSESTLVQ